MSAAAGATDRRVCAWKVADAAKAAGPSFWLPLDRTDKPDRGEGESEGAASDVDPGQIMGTSCPQAASGLQLLEVYDKTISAY
jgi:hypothetical protein